MSEHHSSRWPRDTKPAGMKLALFGAVVIVVFGAYLVVQAFKRAPLDSPVWLGVILGVVMLAYGLYRRMRGPGALDFPEEGGTNVDNK
ncbi:hypothetical protein [Arthrobacter sp. JSM 101049]|uniref:hypothetical protein n=1 Tax=Arthrobacter sp. JSM 101049 TaxID=929097 RepID=UPI0035697900